MTTTHRITTTGALILSLSAAGALGASAQSGGADTASTAHQRGRPVAAFVYSRQDKSLLAPDNPPQAVVRVEAPGGGFDWGDAGIGAAGGIALSTIAIGGALVASQRRTRRSDTAPTS